MNERIALIFTNLDYSAQIIMEIIIPENRDAEEYIDEMLDSILAKDLCYYWDFVQEMYV